MPLLLRCAFPVGAQWYIVKAAGPVLLGSSVSIPAMTLRVLHIGKFFPPYRGGMETFLADLVCAQRAQGIDSQVLVHGQPLPDDPPWVHRVPVQVQLIYAPIALGFRAALARCIQDLAPDVLHLHLPNNSVFWALTLGPARRIPWLVHWHADVVTADIRLALRAAYLLYRPFEQAVLARAERIIATSTPYLQASEPLRHWRHKCAVVPLAIAPAPAALPPGGSSGILPLEMRLEAPSTQPGPPTVALPWLAGRLRLLSLGRLAHYKGFDTLIRAVAGSSRLQLIIAGDGEERQRLQVLLQSCTPAGSQPNVQLLGPVSDDLKNQLFASCEVFCLASIERTEAFGVVLLEAMVHARPCVVSQLPGSGMPWLVAASGAGWSHLPVGDAPAWRTALESLAEQPLQRQRWGAAGRQALAEQFSMHRCAQGINTQYRLCQSSASAQPRPPGAGGTLIVIPARDEASTIGQVVAELVRSGWQQVFVIDDQSSDGSGDIARRAGAIVARPVLPLGAWGGMQLGIRYAHAHGFDNVITMDADGQHEVQEIAALLAGSSAADVVVGAHVQRASRLRQVAWHWFRTLAGFDLRDLTSGFRLYRRPAMALLAASEATLLDYQDVGVLLLLRKAGLQITEVPVSMNLRQAGRSRIFYSWFSVLRYMLTTTLLCLARWRVRP